jgi:outer membrane biogenesis lipoprotein LolB
MHEEASMKIFLTSSVSLLFLVACTSSSNTSDTQARSGSHLVQANESSLNTYFQDALKQEGDNSVFLKISARKAVTC